MERKEKRWWGWGFLDKRYPLEERPNFWPYLWERLGGEGPKPPPKVRLSQIRLPEPRMSPALRVSTEEIIGKGHISLDMRSRITHGLGQGYKDLVRLRRGEITNPPEMVVYPGSEEDIIHLVRLAVENRWAIVPYGGGTGVVGGLECVAEGLNGAISLDTSRMAKIVDIGPVSMTATAEAGILGPELEEALNAKGYTLGHFPQSFEFSSYGDHLKTTSTSGTYRAWPSIHLRRDTVCHRRGDGRDA